MTAHLLVSQLRFARHEFGRIIAGVTEEEATRRILPMNCIAWIIGHLADQEHRYWVMLAQEKNIAEGLNELVGYGKPASTPSLKEMKATWRAVTAAADTYLDSLTPELLQNYFLREGKPVAESVGTMLMRNIYHYWYHTGEAAAIRQVIGHHDLPVFVGSMKKAVYYPEE